jgi:3-deoxy-D-manno-octulosonic acid kinase
MSDSLPLHVQSIEGGGIVYDAARLSKPGNALFTPSYWADRQALSFVAGGRGGVAFINPGELRATAAAAGMADTAGAHTEWVLRHYRRGGFAARFSVDRYLWLTESRTRSFSEWYLLRKLRQLSLPVPAPVAARYLRKGLLYTADLITERLPDTQTLAEEMKEGRMTESGWLAVGRTVASFHAAGVHHADLNANNILLGAQASCYLLDFDRGRIRSRGAWEHRVLARLKRSLEKIERENRPARFGTVQWQTFLRGYRS